MFDVYFFFILSFVWVLAVHLLQNNWFNAIPGLWEVSNLWKRITFPPLFIVGQNFRWNANTYIHRYIMRSKLHISSRMDGSLSSYNEISFSERAGQVMVDFVIAVGTLNTSQINNDRGSLIAIYGSPSSGETYFKP